MATKTITRSWPRPARSELLSTVFTRPILVAEPAPPPSDPPQPRGALDQASAEEIRRVAAITWSDLRNKSGSRDRGLRRVLTHLASFPGQTWQQRWEASGRNVRGRPVRDLARRSNSQAEASQGFEALCCLRVIQPSLEAFRSNRCNDYAETFRTAQADSSLDAFFAAVAVTGVTRHWQRRAVFDVCCALTTQGIGVVDLTPTAFLHYARTTRQAGLARSSDAVYVGHLAWQVLYEAGYFPRSAPATLRIALRAGRRTPDELVDQYQICNPEMRRLFIDYLERRGHELSYGSLNGLATTLVRTFWKCVEQLNPGQSNLRLSESTYQQWREAIRYLDDGRQRLDQDGVLVAVRALYFDVQAWATQEPERWSSWVAPCPVPQREMRAGAVRRRRTVERMADRTRQRQPLLPLLVEHVERSHHQLAELLAAGGKAAPDELFDVGSRRYRRLFTNADRQRQRHHGQANVRVCDVSTGAVINVTASEETAFWEWAIVEMLRQTGVRIEELLELSQLSVRQYQRPNGEVIALLVIAPSKTDRERVIPMSAELFHVVACIIRRLSRGRRTVSLATRHDPTQRVTSTAQPFLFQRQIGQRNEVMCEDAVTQMLLRVCNRIAKQQPQFAEHPFTCHDFRRLFATDLVNHGLPIHIGAALLGHLNIQTTRGYVAVFEEDVVRHYQDHLARRRTGRPQEEYRPTTEQEWREFEGHFDKRKLELGACGRPYATPCIHEHACIRCPMLHIDPKMLGRLEEIELDLLHRRARAESERWLGEIEAIDLTLTFLRDKRAKTQRVAGHELISLELPSPGRDL